MRGQAQSAPLKLLEDPLAGHLWIRGEAWLAPRKLLEDLPVGHPWVGVGLGVCPPPPFLHWVPTLGVLLSDFCFVPAPPEIL